MAVLCLIPVLGIRESHAVSKVFDFTLVSTAEIENIIFAVSSPSAQCSGSPLPYSAFYITVDSITGSINMTGARSGNMDCNSRFQVGFIRPPNGTLRLTVTVSDIDLGNGTVLVSSLGNAPAPVDKKITIPITYTLAVITPTPAITPKAASVEVTPKPLPEDHIGAYYPDSEPRVYAWFFRSEVCKQFLSNSDLCVWPRVML